MSTSSESSSGNEHGPEAGSASAPSVKTQPAPKRFGGCLLYLLLFLFVQPVLLCNMLWQFSRGGCPGVPSYAGYAVTCQIYWPAMIYNLILVGLVLVVLSMFLRKKRIVPALFIGALVIAAVLNAIIAALTHPYFSSDLLYRLMVLLGNSLFLIPYLTRARRVKDTFVVELSPDSLWDRLFIPLDRPLERFYGWLTGIGRWIFLLSPGFAVVIMLFCGILWDMVNRSLG